MAIRPILSTLARHRIAAGLIVVEVALSFAIVCNALHMISLRVDTLSAESGLAAKLFQCGKRAEISLLYRVLRLGVVAQDAARDTVHTLIVACDDDAEGIGRAACRERHKRAVGARIQRYEVGGVGHLRPAAA